MSRIRCAVAVFAACASLAFAQPPAGNAPAGGRGPGGPPMQGGGGRGGFAPIVPGERAQVPPQVEMARPSAAEIDQMNKAIQGLVEKASPADKALLKKYEKLVEIKPVPFNVTASYTPSNVRRGARHDAFVEQAKKGGIDLLLEGDSITDWWVQGDEKKAMFEKYFGQYKTANFAIAGDTTNGLLWALKNGEGQGFQPKAIMLMIGTNSTGGNSAPEIAEGVGAVVQELRNDFPNAKILLLAIFPRSTPADPVRAKIDEINRIISKLDDQKHVFYMDINKGFLDADGNFLEGTFQGDRLHPAPKGYDIWGAAVKDKIAELMK